MDRLSNLLSRFGVRANLFYDGDLCGSASYDGAERRGYIHLLQAGSVTLLGPDRKDLQLTRPSLILCHAPPSINCLRVSPMAQSCCVLPWSLRAELIILCRLHYRTVWCSHSMICHAGRHVGVDVCRGGKCALWKGSRA